MPSEPYVATVRLFQDPPAPYTPREGDVIERGDERWVFVWASTKHNGHIDARKFTRRSRWGKPGEWQETGRDDQMASYWAALVNHMGWRLLPRGDEAPQACANRD